MTKHLEIYLQETGLDPHEILCEVCKQMAVDIHHIKARGMGGSNSKDHIENLMAVCRDCHIRYGDYVKYMDFLKDIHKKFLETIK